MFQLKYRHQRLNRTRHIHRAKYRSSIVSVFQNAHPYYHVTNLSHDNTKMHFEKKNGDD